MKKNKPLIRRLIKIALFLFVLLPVLIIIFISPITKYLVEKYDVEYTGREISMDWAYVNPFTGYIHFSDVQILEAKKDSVFLSAKGLQANFEILELFSGNYIISNLTLNEPRCVFVMDEKKLNLDDIIEKFSPDKTAVPAEKKEPLHFSILEITVDKGEFHYRENNSPVNYFIRETRIDCSGIRWNSDTIGFNCFFLPGIGSGELDGHFVMNTSSLDYKLAAVVKSYDLSFIGQYLEEIVNYGAFRAKMDADIVTSGNFSNARKLDASGTLDFTGFHFGKDSASDFASFEKLSFDVVQLNPDQHKYLFDSVLLYHPVCKYELYDSLDNIQVMFGKEGSNIASVNANPEKFNLVIEIAKYIKKLSSEFLASDYQIKKFGIYRGDMQYSDFALNEEFTMAANPLTVEADSIDKNNHRVEILLTTGCEPYGNAVVSLSINPKDSGEFDMRYSMENFSAAMFNPYLITYTSFPLDRGTIQLKGTWTVRNSIIQSDNHLIIIDPRVGKRIKKKGVRWIPTRLVMAFVRERGNVIDYQIPITGDLRNPKFHFKDMVVDLVKNIFVKPPTTPYQFEVRTIENKVEKSLSFKWGMRQFDLYAHQEKFIRKIAGYLEENPQSTITVTPVEYRQKEKEYILFFEAKKKYYLRKNQLKETVFSEKDSVRVDEMSNKDPLFLAYLNAVCHDTMLYTAQQQCYCLVGYKIVDEKFKQLQKNREKIFLSVFEENGTAARVKFMNSESNIPYNGYSTFRINYKGDIPEFLIEAYEKMDELNDEVPRKKYFPLRKKNKKLAKSLPFSEQYMAGI